MSVPILFVDCETTGLDPDRHHLWEVAVVDEAGVTRLDAQVHPNLTTADPAALRSGGYYDRRWEMPASALTVAKRLAELLDGATLAGAAPHFEAAFIGRFLRAHGQCGTWSHRLLDVCTFAAPVLGWDRPRGLADTARALGLDVDDELLHTAGRDAHLAWNVWNRVVCLMPVTVYEEVAP